MKRLLLLFCLTALGCQGLPVHTVNQDLKGTYDVETRYDMKAFEGTFQTFSGRWSNPQASIRSNILSSVESNYGATIANAFVTLYGDQLDSDLNDYMANSAPTWLSNLGTSMEGVDKQLQVIDMQQAWLFADDETGTLEATQIFNGVSVFADPNCPDSDAIVCDQIEVNSDTLLNAEYPVEILSSRYQVDEEDGAVDLSSHNVEANYGRFGLYLLTNLILPDEPAEGLGLRDVALGAINCRGLAGRLANSDSGLGVNVAGVDVGLSLDDLVGNCEEGVFGEVNRFVDGFNVPLAMELSGKSSVLDTNRDGRIDQLNNGEVGGDMSLGLLSGQTEEGPVTGLFTGFRVQ